ncbi:MAG: M23 family metallopeptidase [Syntrophales bacterium]|jgi:lipoprotein NlpD|nr:M23 family metallopeptidase [Syntrophales bacterium]
MEKLNKEFYRPISPAGRWGALAFFLLLFIIISCSGLPFKEAGPSGVYHRVKSGETLSAIAKAYHTDLQSLAEINNITNPSLIEKDSVIFIPHAQMVIDEIEIIARAKKTKTKSTVKEPVLEKRTFPTGQVVQDPRKKSDVAQKNRKNVSDDLLKEETIYPSQETARKSAAGSPEEKITLWKPEKAAGKNEKQEQVRFNKNIFIWPVKGKVVSFFGVQPNRMVFNGIRIAAPEGAVVVAAGDGVVIHSDPLKYYGETIIIQHADDYASVYANLGVRIAGLNERVKKGDRIGFIGSDSRTGEATLHFEIRNKNKARNPLFFLP